MTEQTEFVLTKERKTQANLELDVVKLQDVLGSTEKWMHASSFRATFGWTPRYTRLLASMAGGEVISGNQGYRATRCADPAEVIHFINRTRKQARELEARALDVQKFYHRYGTREA